MYTDFVSDVKKYPLLRILIPFIFGIYIGVKWNFSLYGLGIFLIIIFVLLFFTVKLNLKKKFVISGIIVSLFFLVFAIFYASYFIQTNNKKSKSIYKNGYLLAEVSEPPKNNGQNKSLIVEILAVHVDNAWQETTGRSLLYVENDEKASKLKPGDKIIFMPELSEIENKGNPEEFDYKNYLAYNLIYSKDYLSTNDWQILESSSNLKVKYKFLRFREKLIEILQKSGLNGDELAVASALTLGYKDSLNEQLKHSYSSAGAMHVLAVSGLHVGVIYGIVAFIISLIRIDKFKYLKVIIILLSIWFYAFLTGLSPSITRASLMISLVVLGQIRGKSAFPLNSLALAAIIILLINPYDLFNLSFQFSFVAVTGILLFYPKIYNIFSPKNKFIDKIWSLTSVSIAAQLATFPLGLMYFNQFSSYFLITNYILIPIATIAIWLAILVFLASLIGFGYGILGKILSVMVKIMNESVLFIESLPFSVLKNIYIDEFRVVLLYLIIISLFIFFFKTKEYRHIFMSILFLIIFNVISLINDIKFNNQKHIIIYNLNNTSAYNFIDGHRNVLFANLSNYKKDDIDYAAKNFWLKTGVENEKYIDLNYDSSKTLSNIVNAGDNIFYKRKFIAFNGKRIFIIDKDFVFANPPEPQKIKLNYLIFSDNPEIDFEILGDIFEFDQIIIDSSNKIENIQFWLQQNKNYNYKIFVVPFQGAFMV